MKKNLLALLLGCVLTVMLLGAVEIFFRLNENFSWLPSSEIPWDRGSQSDDVLSQNLFKSLAGNPVLDWQPLNSRAESDALKKEEHIIEGDSGALPCCLSERKIISNEKSIITERSKKTGKIISQAEYTLDEAGRRITPVRKNPVAQVLMFGDSYTLGETVNDAQTAPYQLGQMRPTTQVYNFGLAGGSPNEFLYELQKNPSDRIQKLPVLPTIVMYTYMDNHLERLFCRSTCIGGPGDWIKSRPYYVLENGAVTWKGFFNKDRRLRNFFYSILSGSALLRHFHVVWPVRFTQTDFDFFAELMLTAQTKVIELFPSADFYVVLYPGASSVYGVQLRNACEKRGLKVLDYSGVDMFQATGGKDETPGDGHPSPVAQYLFAWLLNRDLPN